MDRNKIIFLLMKVEGLPDDVPKTAIVTPFGLFEFLRMPFGLRNIAQTFQHFIDQVLHGLPFVYAYIDDVLVASTSPQEHQRHLRLVFDCFKQFGITINCAKCEFGVPELTFLGHLVYFSSSRESQSYSGLSASKNQKKLREFLGIVNFYHRFLPRCAHILNPPHHLLKTTRGDFNWSSAADNAFEQAEELLATATLLNHPAPDAPTCIMTDASDVAVGAVLQQFIDGIWKPISYFSRKLNPAESRYSTYDQELLAIYLSIRHFRHFIEGRVFHVVTDHKPLTYSLATNSNRYSPRQIRHLDFISQFTSDIRHVNGHDNSVAEALSCIDVSSVQRSSPQIDFNALAAAQQKDTELQTLRRY